MSQDLSGSIWNDGLLSMPPLASDWDHAAPHLGGASQNRDDANLKAPSQDDGTGPTKLKRITQPFALSGSLWGQNDGVQPAWTAAGATMGANESVENPWGGSPTQGSPASGPLSLSPSTSSDGSLASAAPVPSIGMDLANLAASSMTLEPTAKPFTPATVNPPSDPASGTTSIRESTIRDAMVNAPTFVPKNTVNSNVPEFVPKMGGAVASASEFITKGGSIMNAPEFVPKLGANAINAPAFVPKAKGIVAKNVVSKSVLTSTAKPFVSSAYARGSSREWEAKAAGAPPYQPQFDGRQVDDAPQAIPANSRLNNSANNTTVQFAVGYDGYRGHIPYQIPQHAASSRAMEEMIPVKRGGCMFFVPLSQANSDELQLHMGSSGAGIDPLQVLHLPPSQCSTKLSLELPDEWRQHYDAKKVLLLKEIDIQKDERLAEVPPGYDSILPLDSMKEPEEIGSLGIISSVFKVKSEKDGVFYALRKLPKVTVTNAVASRVLDSWRNIKPLHPSIVLPKHIFTHNRSLIFVRKYFPGAQTLRQRYIENSSEVMREERLWGYICQLVSALRSCHAEGLPCRVMNIDRILVSAHDKLRINDICVMDLVDPSPKSSVEMLQDDLRSLGMVIASLATKSVVHNLNTSLNLQFINENFSSGVSSLLNQLLLEDTISIERVCDSISGRLCAHLQQNFAMIDCFDSIIAGNCTTGSILKMMMKVCILGENEGDSIIASKVREQLRRQVQGGKSDIVDFEEMAEILNKELLESGAVKRIDHEFSAFVEHLRHQVKP